MTKVIKKDGTLMDFNSEKIISAIMKSAERSVYTLSEKEKQEVVNHVKEAVADMETIEVKRLHNIVEASLEKVAPIVAEKYREYRNYKVDFVKMLDDVYNKAQKIMYLGDKENSNTDSTLVTTKRSLIYNELNKELYNKFFLTAEERQACRDGFIYIHDKQSRRDSINCCLFNVSNVMDGGFEMGNIWYNEPKTIDTACDVLGDIIMMSASMQYGGWSCKIDETLGKYARKSYEKYLKEYSEFVNVFADGEIEAHRRSIEKTTRDLEQGIQGLEYKLNTVASSRGDYPFVTFALGNSTDFFDALVSKVVLKVRREGQGKEGFKKPVLFPKLVFLYDEEIHGEDKEFEYLFNEALLTSSKAMYPKYIGA